MYFFLASLAWVAVTAYAVRTWDALKRVELQDALALRAGDRVTALAVAETEAAAQIEVARLALPVKEAERAKRGDIQLPDDLEAYLNSWADQFARDDERDAIRHRYLELHTGDADATWQKVRRSFGLGEIP